MRITFTLILLISYFTLAFCQHQISNESRDSLIVINTYYYDLDYGISMFHRHCPNQKTYNKQEQLLREINYLQKEKTGSISINDYSNYYYHNNMLISKEIFDSNEQIQTIRYYRYSDDQLLKKEILISFSSEKPQIKSTSKYKYKNGALILITRLNEHNKKTSKTIVSKEENKVIYETSYNKNSKQYDSLLKNTTIEHFEKDLLTKTISITINSDNSIDTLIKEFTYNEKQLNTGFTATKNDLIISRKKFSYYPNGKMNTESVFNKENKMIEYRVFETQKLIRNFSGYESYLIKNYADLSNQIKLSKTVF